ncbi:MAG TPA: DUF4931 domain-containing protein [Thermoanaerobaculia bacterium]|nr:DUF4931 domain-containing protein [Thermoanaerobaculia bacterium]
MSRLLRDPLTDESILFVPERRDRPNALGQAQGSGEPCPFCPGQEAETPAEVARIGSAESWKVRVVPNRYPAVGGEGMAGIHEVVIESPDHDATLESMSATQRLDVLRAYRGRWNVHSRNRGIRCLVLFRNDGPEAGQTLTHPHAQIIGLPFVPDRIRRKTAILRSLKREGKACPLCFDDGMEEPLIEQDELFTTIAPAASRSPFHVRIVPRRHAADFGDSSDAELEGLSGSIQRAMAAIRRLQPAASCNLVFESAPPRGASRPLFHWSIDIVPRLTVLGGFEIATGIWINVIPPVDAARELRTALEEISNA